MSSLHVSTQARRDRLCKAVPQPGKGNSACPSAQELLQMIGECYAGASQASQQRKIQKDLKELVELDALEVTNPGCKPLRYRRKGTDAADQQLLWEFKLHKITEMARDAVTTRDLTRLWDELQANDEHTLLDASRLRILPDSLRLQQAEVKESVLLAVLKALAHRMPLRAGYRNNKGILSRPVLHPQAVIQRGPKPYLLAIKNDERDHLRFYALNRFVSAEEISDQRAHEAEDFDIDEQISAGIMDFGQGDFIDLELRARGYVAELLKDCPLEPDQEWEDEPDGSAFEIRVKACVPSTGHLFRWILGGGGNLEVIAPESLRASVAKSADLCREVYFIGG